MNGAQSLLKAAGEAGVTVCFANPGTTELDLVTALDTQRAVRPVLTLFEGVAAGAADGFARIAGRPALTLLHLGPGLSNASAYLHNARRAHTPVVNLVGEHATWHRPFDPPLASDLTGLAEPVSVWVREATAAERLPADLADAMAAAQRLRGPVSLLVPADVAGAEAGQPGRLDISSPVQPPEVGNDAVTAAASALTSGRPGALLLGGPALAPAGLRAAARISAATGCDVVMEKFPVRVDRGGDLPAFTRLGYFPEDAAGTLPKDGDVVLAGAREPVAFFGYPGVPSTEIPEGASVTTLASGDDDALEALERLAGQVGAHGDQPAFPTPGTPARPSGRLTATTMATAVASAQPEGAIVVDEGITSSREYLNVSGGAPPYTFLANAGGGIGHGMPLGTGAAVADPDRPVIVMQADGSGMYTLQSLWTQAREGLNVTTVILANRAYRILQAEMLRAGTTPGSVAAGLTALADPHIDWVSLAGGMGVPARRATTADDLVDALDWALAEPGPHLVEAVLET